MDHRRACDAKCMCTSHGMYTSSWNVQPIKYTWLYPRDGREAERIGATFDWSENPRPNNDTCDPAPRTNDGEGGGAPAFNKEGRKEGRKEGSK